ncbi:MAG: DUF1905 domain-containing protein [Acidobacteria bacterium]|nr:DUF1905 domain-containing protein [Acidobacteriota bacterium]
MVIRLDPPVVLDHTYTGHIGVTVKGAIWSAIEIPGSARLFGGLRATRIDLLIDDVLIEDLGLMPTGSGELMISVSAALRRKLDKDLGSTVRVTLLRRLT